jgi:ribonucrease Y
MVMDRRSKRIFQAREEQAGVHRGATAADAGGPVPDGQGASVPAVVDELQARREEIARLEERAMHAEQQQRLKAAELEKLERTLDDRERTLAQQAEELKRQKAVQRKELERLSGLTANQAKQLLIADVEHDARHRAGRALLQIEEETKSEAERKARNILAIAMSRLAGSHASETTTRLIELPGEEMKGRIIGREGRNIRALEALTGVDVIIDETPNAVVVSSFDGVRREVARLTIEKLVADGRIQPATIEEVYAKSKDEVEARVAEEGEKAELEAGVHGIERELLKVLGRLRFRTSYGQNVLDHLVECSKLAGAIAAELGASVETAKRAALLHDIGKAVSHEVEGSHAAVGATMARRHGESEAVAHAIAAHHNEVEPRTVEAVITQAADAISGGRPGARRESIEAYLDRLHQLEAIAMSKPGVEKVFAMQAGRDVRVMVLPDQVDDIAAQLLARDIAKQFEEELTYPGQIKVTVIRESRATEVAR